MRFNFVSCRAAFMCGREPNFELTIEQKDELSKLSWDDFLTMTRNAINSKSNHICFILIGKRKEDQTRTLSKLESMYAILH